MYKIYSLQRYCHYLITAPPISTQDMLHNESIQLDKDFRLSLINDIAQVICSCEEMGV